ncbi:hypothetical protein [Pseudoalteromonas nigrifaciens]|uniref:hypothetical protein n=1 Tax=Pseudoalteromonas nigrifaciens TaxID=28109 RepID=UPI003FB9BCB9
MRKYFWFLLMLCSYPSAAADWLNTMVNYKSQISINFVNLLGNEQASIINKGSISAVQQHYLAGVLLHENKPHTLALIIANLDKGLSDLEFELNGVKVKVVCLQFAGNVTDKFLKATSKFPSNSNLYHSQLSSDGPWYRFYLEPNATGFIDKVKVDVNYQTISFCEIPHQFL